ncbi:ribosome-associated ATPase/putative transporter RbbA [Kingella negevensis]|uniref:Putative ABC transporter ATP-binding protein YbhF n=1 Tax=Kingella negevensis TaxID=1522312 RepID=A0A238HFH0_9NEIS|nr:ribosome-associated ATPase/putative transporter RbbA [Kingella negevensis]MDK4685124.1 ribosome-associated ATPase/putative transporter RbbA [Kingella negevensis]MDK4697414.1 ribosome-associated ATPase/putative transporter RbbA [Kingella negevensis]MDK4706680.1 ribosome-associated ATPase/putative transporter RbbA [Kingella negevensis]MDK4709013.1 ribosome-associated ATPase/putative transporter RbbA [Kingella negevensis]SNB72053.1 putative ABC transporter ATP-binding protein YbhF [Kingella ne
MTNNAVSIQSLSHRYGKVLALDNVSLTIPRGVTVGLIGPDGVGKSTLLSLIAGVRIIQNGSVNILSGDIAHAKTRHELSHRIAYMPQGLGKNLYPTLSVYENIDFHARLFGLTAAERKKRIQRLLDATGLAPFPQRAAGKLSGGMKQKLSLCCALVHNPDLLILDEPTTGVDPLSRRQFWQLVHDLQQEQQGMTVIVATAYIDEAEQFEHLLAMDAGKLLENRPTKEVLAHYGTATLEEAYIKMLPEDRQTNSQFELTPFVPLPDAPPAMKAHGLTKRFGNFTAVDHVSFTIAKGEIFGFLGSNGCGKSTTMKMLTGLLDATEGSAELLGYPIEANSMQTRMKVGYMSQAFSLYEELTVRQNLLLHAKLYQMDGISGTQAVLRALHDFDLDKVADTAPASLPLGIRQRLQLAAACLHHPEVLILDEPTSGVDPAARDMFWQTLLKLSRKDRITIFVSTHFMNEVERCDRISLMHRGRVLAVGTPTELVAQSGESNMEEAFIHYLEQDAAQTQPENAQNSVSGCLKYADGDCVQLGDDVLAGEHLGRIVAIMEQNEFAPHLVAKEWAHLKTGVLVEFENSGLVHYPDEQAIVNDLVFVSRVSGSLKESQPEKHSHASDSFVYWFATMFTFARREAKELLRDKIRLFFALFGPLIMLASIGWSVSFDVNHLKFAVLDRDQSVFSRQLVEQFRGSSYFDEQPELRSEAEIDHALKSNSAVLVLDIPDHFGKDIAQGRQPEIGLLIDGTSPFNATNIQAYAAALVSRFNTQTLKQRGIELPQSAEVVPRYMYNQDFKSVNAIVPNMLMLVLMMIPAIMTALSVVREREIGSIANLYASPASVSQYLLGKQLPYVLAGLFNFLVLSAMIVFWFGVPLKGSFWALLLGSTLIVGASTGLGLMVSSFTKSQTAAFFIAAIVAMVPTVNFSGLMYPVSTMTGGAYAIGVSFPASWYQRISIGGFTKGLGLRGLQLEFAMVAGFALLYLVLACLMLKKQEK